MQVRWSYEGLYFSHTEAESPDPADHTEQGPMDADELIIHAANLYLFRSHPADGRELPVLWSLANKSQRPVPFEEAKRPAQ